MRDGIAAIVSDNPTKTEPDRGRATDISIWRGIWLIHSDSSLDPRPRPLKF